MTDKEEVNSKRDRGKIGEWEIVNLGLEKYPLSESTFQWLKEVRLNLIPLWRTYISVLGKGFVVGINEHEHNPTSQLVLLLTLDRTSPRGPCHSRLNRP